ncbi:Thioredoxin family protein [Alphaproteobacteria bacterium]
MVLLKTPEVNLGWIAEDFELLGTDGKFYNLAATSGSRGLVVVFMCNHCPYVQTMVAKIVKDAEELKPCGINFIGINPNDATQYPQDSYEMMQKFVITNKIPFPYVVDQTQEIARKYDAVCTPDFFGFNAELKLQYRGRLGGTRQDSTLDTERELFTAMLEIAKKSEYHGTQHPSIGCSIKWKS